MKYEDSQLEKLKKIELSILEAIIKVCEENDITYFTVAGTTLGAIRHNGFIPWDDDIDIGMMRDDYERFLQIAPAELDKGYTLTHFIYDNNVPTYFAKVRKDGTKFVEGYTRNMHIHQGVFIDIFPYDKVPEDRKLRKRYNRAAQFWNQLYIAKSVDELTFHSKRHINILKTIRKALHILMKPVSKSYLFKKTDQALRKYNDQDTDKVSSRGLDLFFCNLEDLVPPSEHIFETIKVKVPANPDRVLTKQYGNYMKLPPEEDRYNHAPALLEI